MAEIVEVARDQLVEVYDRQAKKLLDLCYEQKAGKQSVNFLKRLSFLARFVRSNEEVLHLTFHENHIPCLIVIPDQVVSWLRQLKDVFVGQVEELSRSGECDAEARAFYQPPSTVPNDIYLIFDVEPGIEYREDINNVRRRLNEADRRGLTVEEAIALLCWDPEILTQRNLYLLGCPPVPSSKVMAMRADKGTFLSYANGVRSSTFGMPSTLKWNP